MHNAPDTLSSLATKKRSRNPLLMAFGQRLEALRGKATREQISIRLGHFGARLGGSTLAQYERGTVWAPDPVVLWALSEIYKEPHEALVRLLTANRADPNAELNDLLRHGRTGQQAPHHGKGEPHVPSETRIRELQARIDELETYETIIRHIRPLIREVATAIGEEGDPVAQTKTPRGRRH